MALYLELALILANVVLKLDYFLQYFSIRIWGGVIITISLYDYFCTAPYVNSEQIFKKVDKIMMSNERVVNGENLFSPNPDRLPDKETRDNLGAFQDGFEFGYDIFLKQVKDSSVPSLCSDTIDKLEEIRKTSFMQSFLTGISPEKLKDSVYEMISKILKDDPSRIKDKGLPNNDTMMLSQVRQSINYAIMHELEWRRHLK